MIRVTVELVSANGPERNRVLGTAEIVNLGTGTATHGNYHAKFYGADSKRRLLSSGPLRGHTKPGRPPQLWRECALYGWARNRWHPWLLVLVALLKAVGQEQLDEVLRALRKSGGRERERLGLRGDQPGDVDPRVAKRTRKGYRNIAGWSRGPDGTKRYLENRMGDMVEVDERGNCKDCGHPPAECRDEHA